MRIPDRLQPLLDVGVINAVLRPLMSGKEAAVYLVDTDDGLAVAKVYKEASQRSFKHRADYTEGRKVRNSRSQRAMAKRSKFGREQVEAAWRAAEVDAIHRCHDAGVRVPTPLAFVDGVLVMELIVGEDGAPAPRLVDVTLDQDEAEQVFETLLRDMIRMLLAGVVHGDLSDFNVLMGPDGPVIIDLPQATDPAFNNNARKLFVRDVRNVSSFLARFSSRLKKVRYGEEVWALYEKNQLRVDSKLTGRAPKDTRKAQVNSLLAEMEELEREADRRREAAGIKRKKKFERPAVTAPPPAPLPPSDSKKKRRRKRKNKGSDGAGPPAQAPRSAPRDPAPRPADPLDDLDAFLVIEDD